MQLTRALLMPCMTAGIALWTGTSLADQVTLPYVSAVRSEVAQVENNTFEYWYVTGGQYSSPINDRNELYVTCERMLKLSKVQTDGYCYLALVVPTTDYQGRELEMMLSAERIPPSQMVGDALSRYDPSGRTTKVNALGNGYAYREGRGCVMLTTRAQTARIPAGESARGRTGHVPEIDAALSGACVGVVPQTEWCAMETREAEFNFGTHNISTWSGQRLTKAINVQCTGSVKYQLRTASGARSISLSNGGLAMLDVDGGWGQTVQGVAGTNTHTLGVELTEPPLTSGPYNGSEVISVSYP